MENTYFGNYELVSSSGVAFRRNPKSKKEEPFTNFYFLARPKKKIQNLDPSIDQNLEENLEENLNHLKISESLVEKQESPDSSEKTESKTKSTLFFYNQEEMVELMAYMDRLFEYLPEDVIRDFARSSFYEKYNHFLTRLGIVQEEPPSESQVDTLVDTLEELDRGLHLEWSLEESLKQNVEEELI